MTASTIFEIIHTIVNVIAYITIIRVFLDYWKYQRVIKRIDSQTYEIRQAMTLILFALKILEPENKDKVIDPKNKRLNLTFNLELLQRVDEENGIKRLAKSLEKMAKAKKKAKKKGGKKK